MCIPLSQSLCDVIETIVTRRMLRDRVDCAHASRPAYTCSTFNSSASSSSCPHLFLFSFFPHRPTSLVPSSDRTGCIP